LPRGEGREVTGSEMRIEISKASDYNEGRTEEMMCERVKKKNLLKKERSGVICRIIIWREKGRKGEGR